MATKKNIIIKYSLTILTALALFWIVSDHIFFSNKPMRSFQTHETIIALVLSVLLFGLLVFFLTKQYKYKPSVITLGVLSILFIILLIRLCVTHTQEFVTTHNSISYNFISEITASDKFRYISQLFATFAMGFLIIDVLPKMIGKNEFKWVLMVLLAVIYILIIISYFTDFRSYLNLITFKSGDNSIYDNGVKSVFPHKTVFGYIVMIGGFIALYLFATERKWYWLANVGIIFIHLICTLSKLAIIIFFVASVIYLLYMFFRGYKDNLKRNKKILIISLIVLGILLLTGVLLYFLSNKVKDIVNKLLYPSGYNTFTTRTWIWSYTMEILKQTSFSLGAGFKYFGSILKQANLMDPETALVNNTSQTHNAYISMLANGGILLLVAYLFFIVLMIQIIVKLCKRNLNIGLFYGVCLLALLVYGGFEAAPIVLATSVEHALGGGFVIVGLLLHYRNEQLA